MSLLMNIEDLLNKRKIESNRIEFKAGWNPDKIYHSICAFANDLDNLGGGYILVGVEENNGVAKRPVKGVLPEQIDKIQKEMLGYDAKIDPFYRTRVSVEMVDGRHIMVIWIPAGEDRPYSVAESVVSKRSVTKYYIRDKSSSKEARGPILGELRELAHRTPFDDRGNPEISISDISPVLVYDYLKKVKSKLADTFEVSKLQDVLEAMNLLVGPTENRIIKNVAAMMFCENPDKFFPVTQVDIVIFPEGLEENPSLMIEIPKIAGPVPSMIKSTLEYLRTNVIKEKISKPADKEESDKIFNYPYQALEEAVVNAMYHRNYQEREPIEITIEPKQIEILSHSGPDRSISDDAIREAKRLKTRKYRNRRLGDFLKELDLSEGRATGIPTIQKELLENGSMRAVIETDAERTYFLIRIPCRAGFDNTLVSFGTLVSNGAVATENIVEYQRNLSVWDKELEHILEQLFVQVQNNDDKYFERFDRPRLIHILAQLEQVWGKAKKQEDKYRLVEGVVKLLVLLGTKPVSASDMDNVLKWGKVYEIKRKLLNPLLDLGYIAMTQPDKPKSSKQAYKLTNQGKTLMKS